MLLPQLFLIILRYLRVWLRRVRPFYAGSFEKTFNDAEQTLCFLLLASCTHTFGYSQLNDHQGDFIVLAFLNIFTDFMEILLYNVLQKSGFDPILNILFFLRVFKLIKASMSGLFSSVSLEVFFAGVFDVMPSLMVKLFWSTAIQIVF